MKRIILISCLLLSMSISLGYTLEIMRKPSWFHSIKKSDQIKNLDQLVANKKFKEFYQELSAMIEHTALPANQPVTSQQLEDYLYLRYLAASAPLIVADNYENVRWMMDKDHLDLKVKRRIVELMSPTIFDQNDFKKTYSFPKTEAIDLYNETQAMILGQFKALFKPDIDSWKQEQILNYEKNNHLYPDRDSTFVYFNTVNMRVLRNTIVENSIKKQEKYFVEELVKFYPKAGNKVVGLMQKAGYEKPDMPKLINRTAGKSGKTEFLYKILPKENK